jgi:branched-chain amino acid transport system substrate-binding protein
MALRKIVPEYLMRHIIATWLSLLAILLAGTTGAADTKPTLDLYAAYALTGVGSTFGAVEANGTLLAVETFNEKGTIDGKKVRLIVEDTQGTNVQTLSAVRKLISFNGARIILGPTWLDSYQSVLPVVDREKVLLLTPSGAPIVFKKSAEQYSLAFSTWFNLEIEVEVLLKQVQRDNRKRIILAFDQDPFFQTIRAIVQRRAPALGLEVVSDNSFDLSGADFKSMLVTSSRAKADCALVGFGSESNLITFLKQRKELRPILPLYGTDYLDGYVSQTEWKPLFENVSYISPRIRDTTFAERYRARYKADPVLSASTAYDATMILLQALSSNKQTPEAVRDYLLANEFSTVTFGPVRFNAWGGIQSSDFVITKISDGVIARQPVL